MKKAAAISFIHLTFLFVLQGNLLSQNNSQFLPLRMGNVWVYSCNAIGGSCYCSKKIKVKVSGIFNYNNKIYYQSEVTEYLINCNGGSCSSNLLSFVTPHRVDSISANVIMYAASGGCSYSPNEIMVDSLGSRLGDTIKINCNMYQTNYRCVDTIPSIVFGSMRQTKTYAGGQFEITSGRKYAKGIGLISSSSYSAACSQNSYLLGCVINGIVYGDTSTLVGIKQISSEVPEDYSLFQNYPNPFNPVTKIKFEIPSVGAQYIEPVQLKIYDLLGREVATPVNEQLKPGTYEVEWDGSDFSSGVYFYSLTAGDPSLRSGQGFTQTKKLILLK